jgi:putative membrane protein
LAALPLPAVLAALGVFGQILYPLVHGSVRNADTAAVVLLIGAACLAHARRCGSLLAVAAITVVGGFLVELVGVHTGFPFGRYRYGSSLGPRAWGVPLVIALAWPMMAWPAALVSRRLVTSIAARVLVGAWALATWDLFLDPQMVSAGHWRWRDRSPHLPGVPAVPLTNYAGWLGVALLMSLGLQLGLRRHEPTARGIPIPLYLWTWASSTLALSAFLDLGGAALWGGVAMGTVAVPLSLSLSLQRPSVTRRANR